MSTKQNDTILEAEQEASQEDVVITIKMNRAIYNSLIERGSMDADQEEYEVIEDAVIDLVGIEENSDGCRRGYEVETYDEFKEKVKIEISK